MISSLFGESIAMTKVPAVPGWDPEPGDRSGVDAAFFAGTDRQRFFEWLLRMIALATPGVSPSIVDHYITLADHLRQVRSLGSP